MVALLSASLERFLLLPPSISCLHVYSNTSGSFGCGVFVPTCGWFQLQWPQQWFTIDIAVKEFVPVVVSVALWGRLWEDSHVHFHSDNMAVAFVLNKYTAKDHLLNHFLCCLFFYAAYYKFHFSAVHIPGTLNTVADALSHKDLTRFSLLAPQVPHVEVPIVVQDLLILEIPNWISP